MPKDANLETIVRVAHAAEAEVEAKLDSIGLSYAKFEALSELSLAGEPLPLSQLAERLSCVKSNITQLVDRLEADGLVLRQLDSRDRRTRLAVLTAAGRRAVQEGTRLVEDAGRNLFRRLTREETGRLAALLDKIGQN